MACAVSTDLRAGDSVGGFDLDAAWSVHPQVAIRPERFGALLYHFGTRRLSFVKTPLLLAVVQRLGSSRSARTAMVEAGVPVDQQAGYGRALAGLAASATICVREPA